MIEYLFEAYNPTNGEFRYIQISAKHWLDAEKYLLDQGWEDVILINSIDLPILKLEVPIKN